MQQPFNNLTPAEAERLAMLAEECGEVVKVVGKILRHGYNSHHPDTPYFSNLAKLEAEVRDIFAVHWAMVEQGDVSALGDMESVAPKIWARKLQYTHHQEDGE